MTRRLVKTAISESIILVALRSIANGKVKNADVLRFYSCMSSLVTEVDLLRQFQLVTSECRRFLQRCPTTRALVINTEATRLYALAAAAYMSLFHQNKL